MDIGTVRSAASRARTRKYNACRSAVPVNAREPRVSYQFGRQFSGSRRIVPERIVRRYVREHAYRYREARWNETRASKRIERDRNREYNRSIFHRDY